MFTVLPQCPRWTLERAFGGPNNGLFGDVEVFSNPQTNTEEHVHFYCNQEKARKLWAKVKDQMPKTIKSVSFCNTFTVMFWKPKNELRVIDTRQSWRSSAQEDEFEYLEEHVYSHPTFETFEQASRWIVDNYPQYAP